MTRAMRLFLLLAGIVVALADDRRWRLSSGLQCRETPLRDSGGSVLYFHIFKAAGSTIRQKLRKFTHACGLRWACLIHCKESIVDRTLVNCDVKDEINMPNATRSSPRSIAHLERADIIGGHLHFGLVRAFPRARLVTLLRNPEHALVSGIRFKNPTWKLDRVLSDLTQQCRLAPGSMRNAVNYLAEPGPNVTATYAAAAANLGNFDVVGIIENWDVSMRMLEAFLDPTHGWRHWHDDLRQNPSAHDFTTSQVLTRLDAADRLRLAAYVSWERALYVAAIAAHRATCRALLGAHNRGCLAKI